MVEELTKEIIGELIELIMFLVQEVHRYGTLVIHELNRLYY
jgi:hypothetical protein